MKKKSPCDNCVNLHTNCTCDKYIIWKYGKKALKMKDKEPK